LLKTWTLRENVSSPEKEKAFQQQGKPCLNNTAKQLCENKASQKQDTGEDSSDSDFVFQAVMPCKVLSTVQVRINGIKCQVEADSCSTANVIDEERFQLI
jgi:hypothetical protein